MLNIMISMVKKEIMEFQLQLKTILMLVGLLAMPFIIMLTKPSGSILLKQESFPQAIMIFVAIISSCSLISESIISEKRYKTLEMLLSTKITTTAIVLAKIFVPYVISMIISVLTCVIMIIMKWFQMQIDVVQTINFMLFIILSDIVICITTLLFYEDKVNGYVFMTAVVSMFGLLAAMNALGVSLLTIGAIPVLLLLIVVSLYISGLLLSDTKLFTKI